jgi:predicted HTH domain antitoxin
LWKNSSWGAFTYPSYWLNALGDCTPAELKRIPAVTLYFKGILEIGQAPDLAGVSKLEFLALLRHEGVPLNYAQEDAEKDIQTVMDLAL